MDDRLTEAQRDRLYQALCPSFENIWGESSSWPLGHGLLSDVVVYLRGRSLVATTAPDGGAISIGLPLPSIRAELSAERSSVLWAVPEGLRSVFIARCDNVTDLAMSSYGDQFGVRMKGYIGASITNGTLDRINQELAHLEREQIACGRAELWELAARQFGLPPILPEPAGIAS